MIEPDRHVRRDGDDYASALATLLPQGIAWPRNSDSVMMKAVRGLAQVFGYFDSRAADFLEIESDPRITFEMLEDWERNWGLPDPCFLTTTDSDRRHKLLMMKMTIEGRQSREFFIEVAANLGYPIKIFEFSPFMVGISQCGDVPDQEGRPRWEIGRPEIRFYWTVHPITQALHWFRCGVSQCGKDPHCDIENMGDLECIFKRWQPAHTQIVFDYSGVDNSNFMLNLYGPEEELPFVPVEGHGLAVAVPITAVGVIDRAMLNGGLPNALPITAVAVMPTANLGVMAFGTLAATGSADVCAVFGAVKPVGTIFAIEGSDSASITARFGYQATATLSAASGMRSSGNVT